MNSQLAVSQFSAIPTSHYGSFFIWACPFALRAAATAHSIPQAPSGLEWKGGKKTKWQSSSPMTNYCPFKNAVSGILQINKIASITFAFGSPRISLFLEGNISPYCFYIQKVVTPSKIATSVWGDEIKILLSQGVQAGPLRKSFRSSTYWVYLHAT